MLWKEKERPFIKRLRKVFTKKVSGSMNMYIIALFLVMFFVVILRVNFDKQRIYITYDAVDDALIEALVSSATYNQMEYAMGGQRVIFKDVTVVEPLATEMPGATPAPVLTEAEKAALAYSEAIDNLNSTELLSGFGVVELQNSYNNFLKSLKRNLKLDDTMCSSMSGIEGQVVVNEFSVYNKYEQFDDDGNLLAFRYIRYTYNGSAWSVYPYVIDTVPKVYSSYDKVEKELEHTSCVAKISLNVRISDHMGNLMPHLTEADMVKGVTYQRYVDIRD